MKKVFLSGVIFFVALSGCATKGKSNSTGELRSVFDHYVSVSQKPDSVQSEFFTDEMWGVLQASRNNPENETDASLAAINNFPTEIIVENSMEAIDDSKGCLIVQGTSKSGSPLDYNIELVQLNARWVFKDITVTLYDSSQDRWLSEPICDTEQRQLFWLNHLQQKAD